MKVSFSGAQSSGKTTLIKLLRKDDQFKNFKVYTNITRSMRKRGLEINQAGTDKTQRTIMNQHLKRLQDPGHALYDRSSLDGIVYTHYLFNINQVSKETLSYAYRIFSQTIKKYDFIFYTDPSIPLEKDGVRDTDPKFRSEIIRLFDTYISSYAIPVTILYGSPEERLKQIKGSIPYVI